MRLSNWIIPLLIYPSLMTARPVIHTREVYNYGPDSGLTDPQPGPDDVKRQRELDKKYLWYLSRWVGFLSNK